MTTTIKKFRDRICNHSRGAVILLAIEAAIAAGWTIVPGVPMHEYDAKKCCALGTLDLTAGDFQESAARRRWSLPWAWAFAYGFDDNPSWRWAVRTEKEMGGFNISRHRCAFQLGKLVRRWVDERQIKRKEKST